MAARHNCGKVKSIESISFEKRLIILPKGVVSKISMGQRKTRDSSIS